MRFPVERTVRLCGGRAELADGEASEVEVPVRRSHSATHSSSLVVVAQLLLDHSWCHHNSVAATLDLPELRQCLAWLVVGSAIPPFLPLSWWCSEKDDYHYLALDYHYDYC